MTPLEPEEDCMRQQRSLPLTREVAPEAIWERFSQHHQTEVVALYAQLIARAVKATSSSEKKERTQHGNSGR
jgi:predicted Fe-S protein YdhL (DUF1289 family)